VITKSQWIRDYMVANCKMIIGEARENLALLLDRKVAAV
jgi:hypothetical protein